MAICKHGVVKHRAVLFSGDHLISSEYKSVFTDTYKTFKVPSASQDGTKNHLPVCESVAYFLQITTDSLINHLIDLPLTSP